MRFLYHRRAVRHIFIGLLTGFALSGCALKGYHGNEAPNSDLAKLRLNESMVQDVRAALGSPSITSLDKKRRWFYISYETSAWLPTFETEMNRRIVAVQFTPQGRLNSIRQFSEKQGRFINFVPETTPTPIPEVNWIQRLFGNIGRVTPGGLPGSTQP